MNPAPMLVQRLAGLLLSLASLTPSVTAQALIGPGYPAGSPCNGLGLALTQVGNAASGGGVSIGSPLPIQANPWLVVTIVGGILPAPMPLDGPWHGCPFGPGLLWVDAAFTDFQIVGITGTGVTTLTIPVAPALSGMVLGAQQVLGVAALRFSEARSFVL
jgi:hypothetical protein